MNPAPHHPACANRTDREAACTCPHGWFTRNSPVTIPTQRNPNAHRPFVSPEPIPPTPEQPRTYIAHSPSGGRLLVTVWPDAVEVAADINGRWSAPFRTEAA